jgi:hypothetical protein
MAREDAQNAPPRRGRLRPVDAAVRGADNRGRVLLPRFSELLDGARLELRGWRLTPAGARRLAAEPALAAVRALDLTGNEIGDEGLAALLASPHLGPLNDLLLAENHLTAASMRPLAAAPALAGLGELDLARSATPARAPSPTPASAARSWASRSPTSAPPASPR